MSIPDLIVLDIVLPDISGFEICEQLQSDTLTQGIPIIFMTALADTVDKVKGLSLGAVDYITLQRQQASFTSDFCCICNSHLLRKHNSNNSLLLIYALN
ncbi:response regulator receiver sensor signal transduction histidine kinase [Dolichospermum compactum NIES-806]|uniref:Response regulator receiver sensor signal transduction histidine kinase n=2 Tax=Dolichospermum compactum TaxID=136073 RepID=A0A1Z4V012_9CYAN|nr:response regulator receiver sensor signal transduction histidine kinase [Dolichospermum compactum NIES-806]